MLLDNGAQVETRNHNGITPLGLAASHGFVEIINLIVGHEADVDAVDYSGVTPVCVAASRGHKDAVMTLMRHGANSRHSGGEYEDPVDRTAFLCTCDLKQMLELLLNNGLPETEKHCVSQFALITAAHRGRVDAVNTLLEHGADMYDRNFDNMLPIDIASYNGHIDIVQFLARYNSPAMVLRCSNLHPPFAVHVDCRRNTALHLTTNLQAMILLLENAADVEAENVDGLRPIHCAVRTGRVELVELLINHGANVDAADVFHRHEILHEAVCHGLSVVQLLVQRGADLNVQDIDGKTPLHVAIERQQSDVIVFLMSQDADVGLTDVWRNTSLHYFTSELFAVTEIAESVVLSRKKSQHLCIRNAVGVSVSMRITTHGISDNQCHEMNNSTNNSFEHVTQANNVSFCPEKLDSDCYGNTALHHAVGVYGQLKMYKISTDVTNKVQFLIQRGADVNAQNQDGLTPVHVAREEQAINVCLQHADDQMFAITDKRGRNFWHLLFLTRTQNETELGENIRPMIATSDAKYGVDDFNRTPLHYAFMDRNPWISNCNWNWLAKEFIEHLSDEHINKRDKSNQIYFRRQGP